jgi:hypothetical protein
MNYLAIPIIITLVLLYVFGPDGVLLVSFAGPIFLTFYVIYRVVNSIFNWIDK